MSRRYQYDFESDALAKPVGDLYDGLWKTICPGCGRIHGKPWHRETDLCTRCRKTKQPTERTVMHYKNGRVAQNGDKVIVIPSWGPPVAGILYDAVPGNDHCNGKIAATSPMDPCPNLAEGSGTV